MATHAVRQKKLASRLSNKARTYRLQQRLDNDTSAVWPGINGENHPRLAFGILILRAEQHLGEDGTSGDMKERPADSDTSAATHCARGNVCDSAKLAFTRVILDAKGRVIDQK